MRRRRLMHRSASVAPALFLLWSAPSTWGGTVPTSGDVEIPAGTTIKLDTSTGALGALQINGTLFATDGVRDVTADSINIGPNGTWRYGTSVAAPFTGTATITLTGAFVTLVADSSNTTNTNDGVSRGIVVQAGGNLQFFGNPPSRVMTQLNATAAAAATSITLAHTVGWASGDEIAIANTQYYSATGTEQRTLSGATSGTTATFSGGLSLQHYGVLQYATGAGVSLTNDGFTAANVAAHMPQAQIDQGMTAATFAASANTIIAAGTPTVLDERAEVINLSRNIKIVGANDTHWTTNKHGVHIMKMGSTGVMQLYGVELRRCGQGGALGRYPIHWHMNSYTQATGAYTADLVDNYAKFCSIWESQNRAITLHGCCGVVTEDNVAYDISGHAYFFEDGSERRNTMVRNVVFKVRLPTGGTGVGAGKYQIKTHDGDPSGFWLTNPDNTITDCVASDCQGFGFWNSFAAQCWGNSVLVALKPYVMSHAGFSGNVAHSCNRTGFRTAGGVTSEAGATSLSHGFWGDGKWRPTVGAVENSSAALVRQTFTGMRVYKCGGNNFNTVQGGGYHNQVSAIDYVGWVAADNSGMDFAGTAWDASINNCLGIATSLNTSGVAYPGGVQRRIFAASYHSTARLVDNIGIGYGYQSQVRAGSSKSKCGGYLDSGDYYLPGGHVEKGNSRNTGLILIDSIYFGKTISPVYDGGDDFQDGRGFTVTVTSGTTTMLWSSHGKSVNDRISFDNLTGNLPAPLVAYEPYYVKTVLGAGSIEVSATLGGPAITFTTAGTGTTKADLAAQQRRFGISPAIWDANGYLGPVGSYNIPNKTFFTSGASSVTAVTGDANARSTTSKYMGCGSFRNDAEDARMTAFGLSPATWLRRMPMTVERWSDTAGTVLDTYMIRDSLYTNGLSGFVGFSALVGGIYNINYPGTSDPTTYSLVGVSNGYGATDRMVLSIPWNATDTPTVWVMSGQFSNTTTYVPNSTEISAGKARQATVSGASVAAVLADTTGATYYWDTANKKVWVHFVGGLTDNQAADTVTVVPGDTALYQGYQIAVTG